MDISPQESKFIDVFIETGKAAKAAVAAGYSETQARHYGYQLRQKLHIREEIARRRAKLAKRTELTQARMLEALKPILFGNIAQFAQWNGTTVTLENSEEIDDESLEAVQEVSSSPGRFGNRVKIKLFDKLAAWEKVGRMLGWFKERSTLDELIAGLIAIDPELGTAFRDAVIEQRNIQPTGD